MPRTPVVQVVQVWQVVVPRTLLALALAAGVATHTVIAASADRGTVVARIGDISISREEFDQALSIAARGKFYHGKIPEGQMAILQREVAGKMVDNVLLLKEAKRRGLKPDTESIKQKISEYEARYKASPQWESKRSALLPMLQKQLETESMIGQLEGKVQDIAPPNSTQLQSFYTSNLDKFTEPERLRVSVILLKVDPSSPRAAWDNARAEALNLVKRLRGGADFAQQARQRSGDASATNGGDMGYLHRGMLAEPAQVAVDNLKLNEFSEPVTLLQGVSIFRLDERKAAIQNPMAKVELRARELWRREQGQRASQTLLATLRLATPTAVDESNFLPVLGTADAAKVPQKAK